MLFLLIGLKYFGELDSDCLCKKNLSLHDLSKKKRRTTRLKCHRIRTNTEIERGIKTEFACAAYHSQIRKEKKRADNN